MRIGSVANQNVSIFHHLLCQTGVIVQGTDNRYIRADNFPDLFEHVAFDVVAILGHESAMQGQQDTINRQSRF